MTEVMIHEIFPLLGLHSLLATGTRHTRDSTFSVRDDPHPCGFDSATLFLTAQLPMNKSVISFSFLFSPFALTDSSLTVSLKCKCMFALLLKTLELKLASLSLYFILLFYNRFI